LVALDLFGIVGGIRTQWNFTIHLHLCIKHSVAKLLFWFKFKANNFFDWYIRIHFWP
jgi:hypothetical protein